MNSHAYIVNAQPSQPRSSFDSSSAAASSSSFSSSSGAAAAAAPPPPPPPLRRTHAPQPPLLRTAIPPSASHAHGYPAGVTPLSAHTTLSTPFSAHAGASPARGTPTMAARTAPGYTAAAPYNPQQWASATAASPRLGYAPVQTPHAPQTVTYAPRPVGPDEPVGSPPPPYSAEPTASPSSTSPAVDRAQAPFAANAASPLSPAGGPTSAAAAVAPPHRIIAHAATMPACSPQLSSAAFPPPPAGQSRSNSRNPAERFLHAVSLRGSTSSPVAPAHPNASAIDALHQSTTYLLQQTAATEPPPLNPPSARRAASLGALGASYVPGSGGTNSPASGAAAVALPPPPPGPPPPAAPTSRSQSACRPTDLPAHTAAPLSLASRPQRVPVARGSDLGPVPPTPANWEEDNSSPHSSLAPDQYFSQHPLRLETTNLLREQLTQSPLSGDLSGTPGPVMSSSRPRGDSGGLNRSPAVRNRSAQGLRDRRSVSRLGRLAGSYDGDEAEGGANPLSRPLKDIVIGSEPSGHRRASTRVTPQSGNFRGLDEALTSNESERLRTDSDSTNSTPRMDSARAGKMRSNPISPNTPFTPGRPISSAQSWRSPTSGGALNRLSNGSLRPTSHMLHLSNEDEAKASPLRPESSQSTRTDDPDSSRSFATRAMERYRLFAQQEANASNDSERLHLFTQFMVAESQLRREKYASVFREEDIQVSDLLEGIFAGPEEEPAEVVASPVPPSGGTALVGAGSRRSSDTSYADSSSHSRPVSSSSTSEPLHLTLDTTLNEHRAKSFVPALSPIASMSAVTGRDEMDSRGRAASRWWESQSDSSQVGDGFDVLKRSKRESKYMSAVLEDEALPSFGEIYHGEASSSYQPRTYGPNEYPPEKTGWHEPASRSIAAPPTPLSAPYTPDPHKLDISRLITLPPPYPRRHPAVNNSHPDLAEERTTVRALNELFEITNAKETFDTQLRENRQRSASWCEHQRSMHNQEIQFRIERGEITQRDYDAAEAAIEEKLGQARKALHQQTFDNFQAVVVTPIHALINERIKRADGAIAAYTTRLSSDADTHSPNHPQEAGDEKPELLEKLTMLKWLFEARETLYKEKHRMLTQRNDYYKAVILTPYELAGNATKRSEAESFFVSDARKRQAAHDAGVVSRWKELLGTIEAHVTKGVEVQLSAFWDIAPPLQALLQRIPSQRLAEFAILIPRSEVDENPAYWEHPLRYLYSVLTHAEASSRQFVEGQVSLWCLLQEVREAAVGVRWRARASARREASSGAQGLDEGDEREQAREMRAGVDDLKERVGAVEGQWVEGLGGAITGAKESVKDFLQQTGGWDEELEESGE